MTPPAAERPADPRPDAVDDFMLTGMRIPLGVGAPEVMRRNGLDPCRPNPFRST